MMGQSSISPLHFMQHTLAQAAEALKFGEFPIAAVVVLDDRIVARATTSEQRENRFLVHAEQLALEEADRLGFSFDERRRAALYTNLEPCLMCLGAAMSFFLGELYYGLESPGDGAVNLVEGWAREEKDIPEYRLPQISGGLLREESIALFRRYVDLQARGPRRDWAETLTRLDR